MAVKRSFAGAIIYSRRLAKGKVDLMVLFMVEYHCDLFKVRYRGRNQSMSVVNAIL